MPTQLLLEVTTDMLLDRWHDALLSRTFANKTIKAYLTWGRRMAARWPHLEEASFAECVVIASASLRRQRYSATTIHGFQCAMASFSECAWGWNPERRKTLITARPVKAVYTVPDVSQVSDFLAAMPGVHALIATLCYCCGLRISEAVSLRLGDLNLTAHTLTVRLSKCAKGRTIPIPPELVSDIRKHASIALDVAMADIKRGNTLAAISGDEYRANRSMASEVGSWPLFPQRSLVYDHRINKAVRVPIHASITEKAFKECRMKSGVITRITPHRLRDAFAVHSLCAGVPINVIQKHMGHSTVETTAKYLSFLLTDEGAKLFPGLNLFKNLSKAA
jgi:integrase